MPFMRSRAVILIVAILLIAGFAALNWAEIIRPSQVWFGPFLMDAPLGAILLGLLALAVVIFAVSAGALRTQSLVESRQHFKTLEAQRDLADRAEASRFTDLRQHLDAKLNELRERDAIAATEFEKSVVQSQRELRTQLEQVNRTIAARLTELEHRLDSRLGHAPAASAPVTMATSAPPLQEDQVREQRLRQEQARAEQDAKDLQMRQDLARQDTRRDEPRATATDRPAESGWRRWF